MKPINQKIKYHFFSLFYPLWGIRKIGSVASFKIFLARYFAGIWKIRVNGYPSPVYIRGKSSDTKVFFDIIIREEYPLPNFKPDFIVDAGANTGLFSVYYAVRFPEVPIISIEPEASNFEMLVRNTKCFPNITSIQKGLWGESGRFKINDMSSEKWSFELIPDPDGSIEALGMNDVFKMLKHGYKHGLVKLDIEGGDREVMARNLNWLNRVKGIYIEVHGSWRELFTALGSFDYEVSKLRENLYIAINGRRS